MFQLAELYPTQRYVKFEKLVLVKEGAGYYHIPEHVLNAEAAYQTIIGVLELHKEPQEVFGIISLNTKRKAVGVDRISVGSVDACIANPREIFKMALMRNARSIIAFHNHPSGDPYPSPEDIAVTRRLHEAGKILDIELLDHIVCGDEGRFHSILASHSHLWT
ncbi:MAG: JAB domain-containing protein [Alicyclobacillus sp.]|nr:JAB domain-containing protein [Alicyclobacillus sp.]